MMDQNTIFETPLLENFKTYSNGNRIMIGQIRLTEMKSPEKGQRILSAEFSEEYCELVDCSTLKDDELTFGQFKHNFSIAQKRILARRFVTQPNPPFNNLAAEVFKTKEFIHEDIGKIKDWFYNAHRQFKSENFPLWSLNPFTKQPIYHPVTKQNGEMVLKTGVAPLFSSYVTVPRSIKRPRRTGTNYSTSSEISKTNQDSMQCPSQSKQLSKNDKIPKHSRVSHPERKADRESTINGRDSYQRREKENTINVQTGKPLKKPSQRCERILSGGMRGYVGHVDNNAPLQLSNTRYNKPFEKKKRNARRNSYLMEDPVPPRRMAGLRRQLQSRSQKQMENVQQNRKDKNLKESETKFM